ncbi:hypothetical protein FOA52_015649 [Chlamydomonas sp. UWO 241]|nr:hypothetical protein FOA52_015649 [Chlamydomonas sp. UWO 241]
MADDVLTSSFFWAPLVIKLPLPDAQALAPAGAPPDAVALSNAIVTARGALLVLASADGDPAAKDAAVAAYLSLLWPLLPPLPGALNLGLPASPTDANAADSGGAQAGTAAATAAPAAASGAGAAKPTTTAETPEAGALAAAGAFSWTVVLAGGSQQVQQQQQGAAAPAAAATGGVAYEAACVLLSSALWDMVKAAAVVGAAPPGGVHSDAALQASKLLRAAAASLALLRGRVLPHVPPSRAQQSQKQQKQQKQQQPPGGAARHDGDLDSELVAALEMAALAQAQTLSLLRALAKGHSNRLVSGVANDTASLLAAAQVHLANHAGVRAASASSIGGDAGSDADILAPSFDTAKWKKAETVAVTLSAYLRYMYAMCTSLAQTAYAQDLVKQDRKAGAAVRIMNEAAAMRERAAKLGGALDVALAAACAAAVPGPAKKKGVFGGGGSAPTPPHRAAFDAALGAHIASVCAQVVRDNERIYYGQVPGGLPGVTMAERKRLVDVAPAPLPLPSPLAGTAAVAALAAAVAAAPPRLQLRYSQGTGYGHRLLIDIGQGFGYGQGHPASALTSHRLHVRPLGICICIGYGHGY